MSDIEANAKTNPLFSEPDFTAMVESLTAGGHPMTVKPYARPMTLRECADAEERPASPWQPIDTAPKDGTKILIWDGKGQFAAWWDPTFEDDAAKNEACDWEKSHYIGAWTDGCVLSFGYEETYSYEPTHWMPLPPPPTS